MRIETTNAEIANLAVASAASSPRWYAAYTCPRHEKRVAQQLKERGILSFLPTYRSIRRWKDRRKEIELPLFPGYCFVQMNDQNRIRLLQLPGVVNLVSFQGKPAQVSNLEMEALWQGLVGSGLRPHPYLKVGRRVRIQHGPMKGVEGFFVRWKDHSRIVISISLIQRSVATEVDEADVKVIA
jgi:transcription antitermination factor NusG